MFIIFATAVVKYEAIPFSRPSTGRRGSSAAVSRFFRDKLGLSDAASLNCINHGECMGVRVAWLLLKQA